MPTRIDQPTPEPVAIVPAFLRPEQAAAYCSVDRRTINDWAKKGLLHPARIGRRCTLYSRRDLETAVESFMVGRRN